MQNLATEISEICKKITENKDIKRTSNFFDIRKAAIDNIRIILEDKVGSYYSNKVENMAFQVFKKQKNRPIHISDLRDWEKDKMLAMLEQKREIIRFPDREIIVFKAWDVEMKFNDSAIHKELSPDKDKGKNQMRITGDEAFFTVTNQIWFIPIHGIIRPTQQELEIILKWLQKLI